MLIGQPLFSTGVFRTSPRVQPLPSLRTELKTHKVFGSVRAQSSGRFRGAPYPLPENICLTNQSALGNPIFLRHLNQSLLGAKNQFYGSVIKTLPEIASKFLFTKFALQTFYTLLFLIALRNSVKSQIGN